MTDQIDTSNLSGDEAMAFRFLNRAANAIVSASDLSVKLDMVSAELKGVTDHVNTLEEIKRTQDETIATLRAQLQSMTDAEARAQNDRREALAQAEARQRDIDLLDGTVADLRSQLAATRTERDDYGLKHMEAVDALAESQRKLGAIVEAMEKVGFNVSAVIPPEPEPDYRDYAADNPEYRREPLKLNEPDYLTPVNRWDGDRVQPEERAPDPEGRGPSDPAWGDGPIT